MHCSRGLTAGTIHVFFEGYFAYNHTRMAPATDLLGQMWKEYAYSDSRYLTSDPLVLCMETITAVSPDAAPKARSSSFVIGITDPISSRSVGDLSPTSSRTSSPCNTPCG